MATSYLTRFSIFVLLLEVFNPRESSAIMTKRQLLELLKTKSPKWKQTLLLKMDADAKVQEATSALLPHVGAFARQYLGRFNQIQYGFSDPGNLAWFTAGTVGLQFGIMIFDKPSLSRLSAAHQGEDLANISQTHLQSELTYAVLLQYLNVQRIIKNLSILAINIKRDENIFKAAQEKIKIGFGVVTDLDRAEALLQKDKYKELETKSNLLKACQELGDTIGDDNLVCDFEPLDLKLLSDDDLKKPEKEVVHRADVTAAHLKFEAMGKLKNSAEEEWLPKLSLYGELGTFGMYPLGGISNGVTGVAGVQLSFPLYTGGLNSGKTLEETTKFLKAALEEEQLNLEARSQLRVALSQLESARYGVELTLKQVQITNKELEFMTKKFQTGSSGMLDLSNAQSNLATAEDLSVQATFAYEASKLSYFRAIGEIRTFLSE